MKVIKATKKRFGTDQDKPTEHDPGFTQNAPDNPTPDLVDPPELIASQISEPAEPSASENTSSYQQVDVEGRIVEIAHLAKVSWKSACKTI